MQLLGAEVVARSQQPSLTLPRLGRAWARQPHAYNGMLCSWRRLVVAPSPSPHPHTPHKVKSCAATVRVIGTHTVNDADTCHYVECFPCFRRRPHCDRPKLVLFGVYCTVVLLLLLVFCPSPPTIPYPSVPHPFPVPRTNPDWTQTPFSLPVSLSYYTCSCLCKSSVIDACACPPYRWQRLRMHGCRSRCSGNNVRVFSSPASPSVSLSVSPSIARPSVAPSCLVYRPPIIAHIV